MSTRRHTLLIGSIALLAVSVIYVGMQARHSPLARWAPGGSSEASSTQASSLPQTSAPQHRPRFVATPRLRSNPADKLALDSLVVAPQFAHLMERARKDPAFAYALAEALGQCALADKAYESLSRRAADPNFKYKDSIEPSLANYDRQFAKCRGLTADQTRTRLELVTSAANAGVLEAQIGYARIANHLVMDGTAVRTPNLMDEIRTNSEAFTLAAARSGDAEALYNASIFYSMGHLVPRDNLRAYNFYSAYARLQPAAASSARLAALRALLTPEQLSRAR